MAERPSAPTRRHATDAAPIRVVYVIGSLGKGGAEYQLHELIRHLDRDRFEPVVVCLSEGGHWAERLRALDVVVWEIPQRHRLELGRLLRLRARLRALAPSILHTVLWPGNSYGRLAAIGLGVPVIVAAERNVIRRSWWQRRLEAVLDRVTSAYLTNAQAIVDEMTTHGGLPAGKMHVVPNGVDLTALPTFTPDRGDARLRLGWPVDRRVVAQVGRLEPQKDYPTFLRAMQRVAADRPDVDIVVVGEGGERGRLETLVSDLGLGSRVRFLGLRHDVPAILAATDVMVLASRWEGLPNVVIEAMATGAVVVATDVGGARALLRDGVGEVVAVADVAAIARAVLRVLGDDDARTAMAARGRRRVESDLTTTAMAAATMDVYARLLERAG